MSQRNPTLFEAGLAERPSKTGGTVSAIKRGAEVGELRVFRGSVMRGFCVVTLQHGRGVTWMYPASARTCRLSA